MLVRNQVLGTIISSIQVHLQAPDTSATLILNKLQLLGNDTSSQALFSSSSAKLSESGHPILEGQMFYLQIPLNLQEYNFLHTIWNHSNERPKPSGFNHSPLVNVT